MKKYYLNFMLSIIAASTCSGGAQQWNIILSSSGSSGPTTYTIPAGKAYILEAVSHSSTSSPSNTQIRVLRKANNFGGSISPTVTIKDTYKNVDIVSLPNKIRLQAGELLMLPSNATYTYVMYYGLLVDEADLYAANIPVDLVNPRVSGGKLMADAKLASPRPAKISIESATTDLSDFIYDPTGETSPTTNPTTKVVSVDKGTDGKKFLRVMATTRGK